jgi:PadR family transcriptional regulator, regulatory protein PadR
MERETTHARAVPLLSSTATPAPGWPSSDQAGVAASSSITRATMASNQTEPRSAASNRPKLAHLLYVGPLLIVGRVRKPKTRMGEPTYFVLASLLDGPLHGYAIIKRAAALSAGRVQLATGTLYTALDRLSAEGHVELVREEIVNGRARRTYGLTPSGAGALRAEASRMAEAARLVTNRGHRAKAGGSARKASPA